ncbi:hypothetical protein VTG60DRAFT_850 [Thermothelomyces hinnuleus]
MPGALSFARALLSNGSRKNAGEEIPEQGYTSAYLHPRANTAGSPSGILDLADRRSCTPIIGHGILLAALCAQWYRKLYLPPSVHWERSAFACGIQLRY